MKWLQFYSFSGANSWYQHPHLIGGRKDSEMLICSRSYGKQQQLFSLNFTPCLLDRGERQSNTRRFSVNLELSTLRGGGWAHNAARQPKQGLPKHTIFEKQLFAGKVYFEAGVITNICQLSTLVEAEGRGNTLGYVLSSKPACAMRICLKVGKTKIF